MSETKSPFGTLSARVEERILQPLRVGAFARRTWFSVTVALILAVYGGLLGWMLWRDASDPPHGTQAQETAVEVVAEMPKTPALPMPPAPKQEMEKPASSAPRAVNDVREDTERADKDTHAPKTNAPPVKTEPPPVKEAAKDPEPAQDQAKPADEPDQAAEAPKPPDVLDKEAEALDRLPPEPPKKPKQFAKAKPTPPKPPHRPETALQQLAGASDLPDYTFAKPMRKRAKVSGGTEDNRYLAVVYGLITQNRRPISVPYGDWSVAVSFVVDGGGNLLGVQVSKSSGYPEVDQQAVEAVESAAPFPPPPSGGRTGLVARLRSIDADAMAGGR